MKVAGIGCPLSSVKVHNADGAGGCVAQPARERRTPAAITGNRKLEKVDDLFIAGIPLSNVASY